MRIAEWNGIKVYEDNLPENFPGIYIFFNLVNGKCYVGESVDVKMRILQHIDGKGPRKFRNAVGKYGWESFLVVPVWYDTEVTVDKYYQLAVETTYIMEFDSIRNGYNVLENYHQGAYGKEWSDYLKAFWTPELRKRQSDITTQQFKNPERRVLQSKVVTEISNRPEVKQKFIELQRKLWSDPNYKPDRSWQQQFASDPNSSFQQGGNKAKSSPEAKERGRVRMVARYSDPEERSKQSERLKNYLSDPDVYQKRVEQMATVIQLGTDAAAKVISGSIWITDGTVNRRFNSDESLPIGFSIGRTNFGNLGRKPKKLRRAVL